MKTKLTLSVDKELILFARQQARKEDQTISGLFSEYLKKRKSQAVKSSINARAMVGSLKQYVIDDSKTAIRAAYAKKYIN